MKYGILRASMVGLALTTLGSLTSGCTPYVYAVSAAPPARVGEIWKKNEQGEDVIRVSKGVAFAIECSDAWLGGPCKDATAHTGSSAVARVLPAHLEKIRNPWSLEHDYLDQDVSHRAVFVLAGVETGETTLSIQSGDGNRQFIVEVE
jgi:hypothetical protein